METEVSRAEPCAISPEDIGPPPRRVQLTGNGIASAVVAAAFIGIAVIYAGFVASEAVRQMEIRSALRGGVTQTMGKVETLRSPFHAIKEYVGYTFIADGKTYAGEAIVPPAEIHTVSLNSDLPIRYLPENPAVNHPVDWEWSVISEWDAYFIPILVVGLGCMFFITPQLLFERRMAVEGVVAIGVVTKCSVSGRGGSFINLTYDFRTREGSSVQGRGRFQARRQIGAKIAVLYLPQNPRRNIPYPISTWRIATAES